MKIFNRNLALYLVLGLSGVGYANNISTQTQQQFLNAFGLSSKYCKLEAQVKHASGARLSDWQIDCHTPEGKFISTTSIMPLKRPYDAVLMENFLIKKDGTPIMIKTNKNALRITFKKSPTVNEYLVFLPMPGHPMVAFGGYEKNLTPKYPHTLFQVGHSITEKKHV